MSSTRWSVSYWEERAQEERFPLGRVYSSVEIYSRGSDPMNRLRFVTGRQPGRPSTLNPSWTRHLGLRP
jgi:hypothetical protein